MKTHGDAVKRLHPIAVAALLLSVGLLSAPLSTTAQTPPATGEPGDVEFWEELAFWESIKDTSSPSELEAYLSAYPEGRFRRLAEIRLSVLRAGDAAGSEPAAPSTAQVQRGGRESRPGARKGPELGAGSRIQDCDSCPELVVVPAGDFTMGSDQGRPEERPPHPVELAKPFAIGVYEVTVEEWDACLREGACDLAPNSRTDATLPMSNVSWDDARQYLDWLSRKTGKEYRLPSEAEWEYAASGGTKTRFWWGEEVGENKASCDDCGSQWDGESPAPVGSFEPNPFGLYDIHGNLWEWTQDCVNRSYQGAPSDGTAWLRGDCLGRMLRGGAWNLDADYMRTTRRHNYDHDVRYYLHGFRVVRSLP
ncbi:formylglycine-generating enzyme family protein [Thiorhodococcus minor]|uniref:Formylglycine-generating enzyme family protein n=1 Tax=Thiorhodococcus minor TaxID=57489 RepID=A0A6M0K1Y0_9GAMM|nr:formylglycine-generating enzyme family protein [Thiorhodococcus minor]NEV63344.1 formylglycine-generating enzyme family protein [Thiorhodococcus minor]